MEKMQKKLTSKKKVSHETIQEVYDSFRTLKFQDGSLSHVRLMDSSVHALLDLDFIGHGDWRTMDSKDFFEFLLRQYPAAKNSSKSTLEERFRNLDKKLFTVDLDDPKCYNGLFFAVQSIMEVPDDTPVTETRSIELCKILTKMIGKNTEANKKMQLHMEAVDFKPKTLNDWFVRTRKEMDRVYQAVLTAREYGVHCESRSHDLKVDKPHSHPKANPKRAREPEECTACGRHHHVAKDCLFNNPTKPHPDVNKTSDPWPLSAQGKAWKQKGENTLPFTKTLSGAEWACPVDTKAKSKFTKRNKGECMCALNADAYAQDVVPCSIVLDHTTLTTSMLVDSGALDGDYINRDTADTLRAAGVKPSGAKKRVCGALNDVCEISEGKFPLQVNFLNENTNKIETLHAHASCINTQWPIIIGRPTIKRNNLTSKIAIAVHGINNKNASPHR